jgi:hypothetical protein
MKFWRCCALPVPVFDKWPIRSLALFGSAARGEDSRTSDVDILVEFNEPCHNSPIRARIADGEYWRCKVPRERKYANISVKYAASSATHSAIASWIWLNR